MKKETRRNLRANVRIHKRLIALAVAVLLFVVVGMIYALLRPEPSGTKRLVTFYDRGAPQVVLTRATTVQEALDAAQIRVGAHDEVEPGRDSALTSQNVDVIIYRSRLVAIQDGVIRRSVVTVAQSANAVLKVAKLQPLNAKDSASFRQGTLTYDGAGVVLAVERAAIKKKTPAARPVFKPRADALTPSKGAQVFVDSQGVAHRETYYDLPMNVVIGACGPDGIYTIRSDGAKVDQDGYVLVAANLGSYPRCTVVETSLGPGKVYDTGGFAVHHPYGFDLATDWSNYNGQ
jgi:hypothetical protein